FRSTHNTHIEQLWGEVGWVFCQRWKAFFLHLESLHQLNQSDPHHLWLLQFLFLDEINQDCQEFVQLWNHKPILGPETGGLSPNDLYLLGQVQQGVYVDEFEGVHPEILQCYHRTHGQAIQPGESEMGADGD
ncbi:hypothetical protein P691DRAFT_651218, partial [Macrolepiota fuliginosa MF-IS2]